MADEEQENEALAGEMVAYLLNPEGEAPLVLKEGRDKVVLMQGHQIVAHGADPFKCLLAYAKQNPSADAFLACALAYDPDGCLDRLEELYDEFLAEDEDEDEAELVS